MRILTRCTDFVARFAYWMHGIGAVATLVIMLLTVSNAVGRTFMHPILGVPEIGKLTLVMIIYLQMSYVFVRSRHVAADFLKMYIGTDQYARLSLLALAVGIVAFALITYTSYPYALKAVLRGEFEIAGGMTITVMPARVMVIIGSFACFLYLSLQFLDRLASVRHPRVSVIPSEETSVNA